MKKRLLIYVPLTVAVLGTAGYLGTRPAYCFLFAWEPALVGELRDVDHIRVRTGGTCHRHVEDEKTLFEEANSDRIRELIASIQVDEWNSGFHCHCCGDPSIEFYKGDQLVVTLGYHHGRSLRWLEGWPADGLVTDDSANKLSACLAARGVLR
jgi:hypothetical protein